MQKKEDTARTTNYFSYWETFAKYAQLSLVSIVYVLVDDGYLLFYVKFQRKLGLHPFVLLGVEQLMIHLARSSQ